jgi:hypothetical protein
MPFSCSFENPHSYFRVIFDGTENLIEIIPHLDVVYIQSLRTVKGHISNMVLFS